MSADEKEAWQKFFPYEPRDMQISMIKIINHFLKNRTHIVLEASTGIGKTIVNLATVLPYARKHNKRIIYTARTHAQMDRVIEELQEISKKTPVSGVALRGRESFCLNSMVKKFATSSRALQIMCTQLKKTNKCEYYTNMKDEKRLGTVIRDLTKAPATSEYIFDISESAGVCPAEAVRKILPRVEVIACSYLYLFEPDIRKSFLESINADLEDLIVIIDEAHNLPNMVVNITSDNLSSFSFNRAIREANNNRKDDYVAFFDSVVTELKLREKNMSVYEEKAVDPAQFLEDVELRMNRVSRVELDDEFFDEMMDLGELLRVRLAKSGKEPRSSLGRVGEFFYQWYESIGKKDFSHSIEKKRFADGKDHFVTLNLDSLDSSVAIKDVLSHVFVSLSVTGTLGDPEAHTMLTGIDQLKHITNIFPSPYNERNIKTLVTRELTTMYKKRSPAMYQKMVKAIVALAHETPANVGLFTPSYKILKELLKNGLERHAPKELMIAQSGMSSVENDKLIERFKKKAKRGGAILCSVLGGRSSEGADFPGDTMNAVIIVGIPYAPPTVKVKAQIAYLDSKFPGKGNMLAYEIPAVNRAAQASGRPVRSLSDTAMIMLLDYRFSIPGVQSKLPEWIRNAVEVVDNKPEIIAHKTRLFFNSR